MSDSDPRLDAILDVMLAFARHDFSRRAPVTGTDTLDAIATGMNMLAEELETSVASRRELESAHREVQAANAKLVDAGKMAAVGLLAAGVAHEVNNPAAWVSLALGLLRRSQANVRRRLDEDGELQRDAIARELDVMDALLVDCVEGMQRITMVVGDLRTLARAQDDSFEPIQFDEVIASCCRLTSHHLGAANVVIDIGTTPTLVANRGRISQVVTNLVVNAAHAVKRSNGDPAEIAIQTATLDDGALIAVEDTGPGIPEELRPHVFDPFFTTKGDVDGMGLGLTIVAQIASSYGGWARVGSAPVRRGARVEVWFPCTPRR